jgi:hypothetical protein
MSRSLIRKNQLHPDIADLVSGYGDNFFITPQELADALLTFSPEIRLTGQNVVYTTGNQNISGVKNFISRPTFNGSGLATTGDLAVGTTVFDGNRVITAQVNGFQGVQPGGNDVVSFLNNVFYPFAPATISLNGYAIRELGTTFNNIPFVTNITANSETSITNLSLFSNGALVLGSLNPTIGNNITTNTNLSLTSNSTLAARINVNNNGNPTQISGTALIQFEAPHYFGSGVNNLQANPTNMKNVLVKQTIMLKPSSRQFSVTTNGFYYFVYPDNWGALSRISATSPPLDFNINSDFVTGNVTLTLENNSNYLYRFYKNTNQIILNNYGIVYHF